MNKKILCQAEKLHNEFNKLYNFQNKYDLLPYKKIEILHLNASNFIKNLNVFEKPKNRNELIESELKRRFIGDLKTLEGVLNPKTREFDEIISYYSIPKEDLENIKEWLILNKEKTSDAIERLFEKKEIKNLDIGISMDIPRDKIIAENFATINVEKFHKKLGKMVQKLTQIGEYLRDINATTTSLNRSYFNIITKTLAIGIPNICYRNNEDTILIDELQLIRIYGHEGMGHALNTLITKRANIEYFLKSESQFTVATLESIAQFYEKRIFDDLKENKKIQVELNLHNFKEIYQEFKDTLLIKEYQNKLFQYSIIVLADKTLGNVFNVETLRKKQKIISELSINKAYPLAMIEQYKYSYDSYGNLFSNIVNELRYCATPVDRAIKEFEKKGIFYDTKGRSLIDKTLLTGFYTPIGFVDNARIVAEKHSKHNN